MFIILGHCVLNLFQIDAERYNIHPVLGQHSFEESFERKITKMRVLKPFPWETLRSVKLCKASPARATFYVCVLRVFLL